MRRHIHNARDLVLVVIDAFYPLFRKFMSEQTFRYAACGSVNTLLGFMVYFISYNYILRGENLHLGFYAFKPHVASLFFSFCFSFPFGFFLMKYVVFSDSKMKGRIQLFRYFTIYLFNLVLNTILLKICVEVFGIHAIPAQIITALVIIVFSYLAQRHFTFRIRNAEEDITS